ncbi:MAG: sulfate permease [Prevotellaceae bacterium]|jgi:SulP family sulfate permease|nr:sulfate permease [Prevotellaceae bacterium]
MSVIVRMKSMANTLRGIFQPKFFTLIKRRQYDRQTFAADLIAGLIVGVVAIPLAIAFGIASGVSPQQGLITAVIAGFIISFLGGSHVQIGGPTGAFIVIVYGIVAKFGMSGLIIATVLAGIMLILMGALKLGNVIKFIPYPIVVGFTSGIAVVIFSSQIKDFFGLQAGAAPSEFVDKWIFYIRHIGTAQWPALVIGGLTVALIALWPKVTKRIPGSLVAIVILTGGGLLLEGFGIPVETIGSRFPELSGGSPLPKPEAPTITMETITRLIQPAFTIAMLGAIESLLSAMVADGVTGKKHRSNTELIAQGVANVIVPFFGGIPATGAIARTMTNINNGGRTPVAGIIHAVFLLLVFLFLMPLAVHIPLACLAGVLVMVSYNMSEWRSFRLLLRNPRSDVVVLVVTFFLTVVFDLTVAIEIGLLMAILLFLKRVTETSTISVINEEIKNSESDEYSDAETLHLPDGVEVYEINGPFFFGIANKFDEFDLSSKKQRVRLRIIRMRKVPFIDSTGLHNLRNLWKRSQREKIQLILSGVSPEVRKTIEKSGFAAELGEEFICSHINEAVEKAWATCP